ncbi:hypothetical protein ACFWOB_18660 [Streptomyces sp. NPDC058420]|uniref:LppU/SCO3897 family protein n=1 Tax=Streptomyces sp. NPDC058420 TaxID=3346489 RepID=UPI0036548BD7
MTTPPPQSPNPYAQGQQPYGQPQTPTPYPPHAQTPAPYPPQAQAPYPPQGGYPQQPGQPGFPPQGTGPYAPIPPQPRRRFSFKMIRLVVIIVIGIGVAIFGYISSRDDANTAKVGNCMHRGSTSDTNPDLEVVKCSSSEAEYKVAQKKSGTSASCDRTKYSEYTESGDGDSFTLCLEDYPPSK